LPNYIKIDPYNFELYRILVPFQSWCIFLRHNVVSPAARYSFCLRGRGLRDQRKTRTVSAWILSTGWKSARASQVLLGSC